MIVVVSIDEVVVGKAVGGDSVACVVVIDDSIVVADAVVVSMVVVKNSV